ncbi:hypothetical protein QS713_08315 [Gleimia hominis]|uniref:Uncharacterized protein n=1 Tax=Gleimia hominis TaxID=595468 RepID=A0ABU3ICE6_9ACTO|nr:hypothetical protein [Gleimia hominis]MDT3768059.1 hypothetical protein [Gleimia hominis]
MGTETEPDWEHLQDLDLGEQLRVLREAEARLRAELDQVDS